MFGGACYWREFCISKWVVLDNKIALNTKVTAYKSLQHLTLTVHGLIFGRACYRKDICSKIWGLIFGRAYLWRGLLSEFYSTFASVVSSLLRHPKFSFTDLYRRLLGGLGWSNLTVT